MTPLERRSVGVLSSIYALRMLGLFLIFPVFALYAQDLSGQTTFLIGVALGAYGLSQALLQIPFGMASDRFGRKPVIAVGLLIFAAGSVVAAMSTSIGGVILGRCLQGAGAISAPVMALLADLTRAEQRTKAMALIGISIGASLIVSLILGPLVGGMIGVTGIFWLTACGSLAALALLFTAVPNPTHSDTITSERGWAPFARLLREPQLARLNLGILVVHMTITALFLVVPHILVEQLGLPPAEHWKVYLLVMTAGIVAMVPAMMFSGRPGRITPVYLGGIAVLAIAQVALAFVYRSPTWWLVSLIVFFGAFNLLEALLPSLISRLAPADAKGAAMGIFGTAQFLGAFIGGVAGGAVYQHLGIAAVFISIACVAAAWFVSAVTAARFKF